MSFARRERARWWGLFPTSAGMSPSESCSVGALHKNVPMSFISERSLSAAARSVWAKTRVDTDPAHTLIGWLPLWQHLSDTAGIARLLWDEWVPLSTQASIAREAGSAESARNLVIWLAGTHDIGKASPAFAVQVPRLADAMGAEGLGSDPRIAKDSERREVRHELVSFLALRDWLGTKGFARSAAAALASVVAAHHGRPPTNLDIARAETLPHLVGTGPWVSVRDELCNTTAEAFTSPASIEQWKSAKFSQPTLVLLSSLVIVADWIASSDLFDAAPLGQDPRSSSGERTSRAWAELDLPRRWQPRAGRQDVGMLLGSRFRLLPGAMPRPAQRAFVEAAYAVDEPELMILEADMGSGKTEAAILAAEILAERFGMTGVFVGLPTQATADGMFSRVLEWAQRLDLDTPSSVYLAHGGASLNPEFESLSRAAAFHSMGEDAQDLADANSAVIAHRWFSSTRRGPLSNFVVGTIDQALFAGLRSRYVMLRHLALASKVVVLDEVHAYDAYMQQYLLRVLEWLGAYGVPVVLLSATLPSEQRLEFVKAYDRGRAEPQANPVTMSGSERAARHADRERLTAARYASLEGEIGYPVITSSRREGPPNVITPGSGDALSKRIGLVRVSDDEATLIDIVRSAAASGVNIAVIRNTVDRAQSVAGALRAALGDGIPVILAHSRYLATDRAEKDRLLLHLFGPHGNRPAGSVVVATQVIEQSLDIDFDLMISDAAPIDLLLQRTGRLHRHARPDRPESVRRPRLVVTGVDWTSTPPTFASGLTYVYAESRLLRTLAALGGRDIITTPEDTPGLVEAVYGDDLSTVPATWHDALAAATDRDEAKRDASEHKADTYRLGEVNTRSSSLLGWISGPDVDPELMPPGRATVRDGDATLDVLVLQRTDDGELTTPSWLTDTGGERIPRNTVPSQKLTKTILGCRLRLPTGMCYGNAVDRHILSLERSFELPEWHASHALKGELVLVLDRDGRGRLNEFDLSYTADDGLSYSRHGS